jgi:hypothetical protein
MLCCKPHCGKPRALPWFLCADCLNAWIVMVLAFEPEEPEKAAAFAPALKPRPGGGGPGQPEELRSSLSHAVMAVAGGR